MSLQIGFDQFWEQRTVGPAHDVFVEQSEHDVMEFRVGVLLVMLAPKRAEDDFPTGVGFAFGLLGAGCKSLS